MTYSNSAFSTLPKETKIIVGLSGGVDSSVSALLLKKAGFSVEGLFMKNWEEDDTETFCSAEIDVKDARDICDTIGIKLHTVNFAQEYWNSVFTSFLKTYQAGLTPNPDILCNKEIKFKICLDYALKLGADYFATGHYAKNIGKKLFKAQDKNKDQTYFLYTLTPEILNKVIFPIGDLTKPEVRKIAQDYHLINYNKKDSTGICFIGERKFKQFLSQYLPAQKGKIETVDGKILGTHDGLMYYTRGQRQGINIGGQKNGTGEPFYVVDKDLSRNVLIVAQGHDNPSLYSSELTFTDAHWINQDNPTTFPFEAKAKIRYRQIEQDCIISKLDETRYSAQFKSPQWAITPGQSIVFYQEENCIGGGIITTWKPTNNESS